MVTHRMVRDCAAKNGIACIWVDSTWKITPERLAGTEKGDEVAYYTDDNEDAFVSVVSMSKKFSTH